MQYVDAGLVPCCNHYLMFVGFLIHLFSVLIATFDSFDQQECFWRSDVVNGFAIFSFSMSFVVTNLIHLHGQKNPINFWNSSSWYFFNTVLPQAYYFVAIEAIKPRGSDLECSFQKTSQSNSSGTTYKPYSTGMILNCCISMLLYIWFFIPGTGPINFAKLRQTYFFAFRKKDQIKLEQELMSLRGRSRGISLLISQYLPKFSTDQEVYDSLIVKSYLQCYIKPILSQMDSLKHFKVCTICSEGFVSSQSPHPVHTECLLACTYLDFKRVFPNSTSLSQTFTDVEKIHLTTRVSTKQDPQTTD